MSKINLFCFPYAGGSAAIFSPWKQLLHPSIELKAVELSGRGKRMHESLYKDVPAMIDDVFQAIKDDVGNAPYALYGHSMGAMIAYELAHKIRENNLPSPLQVFVSGRYAPQIKTSGKNYNLMTDEEFKNEVMGLGGTPREFFEYPELLELFMPLLKNDFRLAETEIRDTTIMPLNDAITVLLGKEDDLTAEECDGWKKHTKQLCTIYHFEGGHFFLHDHTEQLVRIICNTLSIASKDAAASLATPY